MLASILVQLNTKRKQVVQKSLQIICVKINDGIAQYSKNVQIFSDLSFDHEITREILLFYEHNDDDYVSTFLRI